MATIKETKIETTKLPEKLKGSVDASKVIDILRKAEKIEIEWNNDPEKIATELAKQVVEDEKQQELAKQIILAVMGEAMPGGLIKLQEFLATNQCASVSLEEGKLAFYKKKTEFSAEAKGALEDFKKRFPDARISTTVKVAVGQKGILKFRRYAGATPILYTESGPVALTYDSTGARSASAEVKKEFIIEARNKDGILTKYVYIEANINGSIVKEKHSGWIEVGRLGQKGKEKFELESKSDEDQQTEKTDAEKRKEDMEAHFHGRAEKARKKFKEERNEVLEELEPRLHEYVSTTFILKPAIIKLVNDEATWKKAWNEESLKGISGLDSLIMVLKDPIFIQAGITETNARTKMLELIKKGKSDRVNLEDILDVFGIYRDATGKKGSFSDFKEEVEKNKGSIKAVENDLNIIKKIEEKKKQALAVGYVDKRGRPNPFALCTKEEVREFFQAAKLLNDNAASERPLHLSYVLTQGANLIEALRNLGIQEFTPDVTAYPTTAETQRTLGSLREVFADGQATVVAWEDALADQGFDKADLGAFGGYFDRRSPVMRIRSRLHSYTDDKGKLDGRERIKETQTVAEYNRLIEIGLRRLEVFAPDNENALKLYQKYADDNTITDTEILFDTALKRLKINKLEDLTSPDADSSKNKETVKNRKDVIKIGFYFDERASELGITLDSKEQKEKTAYSANPLIYVVQKKLVAAGYPGDEKSLKEVENKMIGGGAIKLDINKGITGVGLGTSINLGEGWKILLGLGHDEGQAVVGIGIHKEIKTGEETKLGLNVGPGMELATGAVGLGTGIDFTFPLLETIDASVFGGAGIGYLGLTAGGGVMISGNAERAVKEAERETLGMDKKMWKDIERIDKEIDPDAKYILISQNPILKQIFALIFNDASLNPHEKQTIVLDSYNLMRNQLHSGAVEKTETPGADMPILHQMARLLGGEFRVTGAGIVGGMINGIPYAGPIFIVEIGRKVLIYPRASASSMEAKDLSGAEIQAAWQEKLKKMFPDKDIEIKKTSLGQSGEIMVDDEGGMMVRIKKQEIDLKTLKGTSVVEKYNEAIKPLNMKFEQDKATGLFELVIYDRGLGNFKLMIDPGMQHKGLILRYNRVFLAVGAKPELFISREEFFTPFPKKGSPRNTIVTISNTPKRTRKEIESEVDKSGAYLYKKAGMQWELLFSPKAKTSNTVDFETYKEHQGWFETLKNAKEEQSFDKKLFEEYLKRVRKEIPFVKDYEEYEVEKGLMERVGGKKSFAEKFLEENQKEYRKLTTLKGTESAEEVAEQLKKLVEMLQERAKKDKSKNGMGRRLNDLEVNAVISKLMDLSFSELEKASTDSKARRKRFENNLKWSKKAVLIPFFAEKIPQMVINRGKIIKSSAETLADHVEKLLLERVTEDDLKNPAKSAKYLDPKFMLSSVAGTLGIEGLRGTPYYMQKNYGILGLHKHALGKDDINSDLASIILEIESPLNTKNDKEFQRSPLVRKLIAMPGLWVVLGDKCANEAIDMQSPGWDEFKKLAIGIREAEHSGKNVFSYTNTYDNTYEFHINTKVVSGAHARCGNPLFAFREDLAIYAIQKKEEGLVVAVGNEKTATVTPKAGVETTSFGLAGIITSTQKEEAPPTPAKKEIPTPKEKIPEPTPQPKPEPAAPPTPSPKPAPGVGGFGGKTDGGSTKGPEKTSEGSAGL